VNFTWTWLAGLSPPEEPKFQSLPEKNPQDGTLGTADSGDQVAGEQQLQLNYAATTSSGFEKTDEVDEELEQHGLYTRATLNGVVDVVVNNDSGSLVDRRDQCVVDRKVADAILKAAPHTRTKNSGELAITFGEGAAKKKPGSYIEIMVSEVVENGEVLSSTYWALIIPSLSDDFIRGCRPLVSMGLHLGLRRRGIAFTTPLGHKAPLSENQKYFSQDVNMAVIPYVQRKRRSAVFSLGAVKAVDQPPLEPVKIEKEMDKAKVDNSGSNIVAHAKASVDLNKPVSFQSGETKTFKLKDLVAAAAETDSSIMATPAYLIDAAPKY